MENLTITLTNRRHIDGFVQAANGSNMTPEELAFEFLSQQGERYADGFGIGVITSAALIKRFTPAEYGVILVASVADPEASLEEQMLAGQISALIDGLTSTPQVNLDDPRILTGLEQLVAIGLLEESRIPEIIHYDHIEPVGKPQTDGLEPEIV